MIFYLLQQFPVLFQTQCIDPLNNDVICGKALKSVTFVLKIPVTRGDLSLRHVPCNPFSQGLRLQGMSTIGLFKDLSQRHLRSVCGGNGICM